MALGGNRWMLEAGGSLAGRARWLQTRLGWVTLVGLTLGCSKEDNGASAPPVVERPNVLLITLDTLRSDHLGCYGYEPYAEPVSPHLDQLAMEGVRFTECYASRSQTAPSLASLMTGCYPSTHGIRENTQVFVDGQTTLGEVFRGLGYETAAHVSYVPSHVDGFPGRGVEDVAVGAMIEGTVIHHQYEWDANTVRLAADWLRGRQSVRPFFLWVHLYSIHRPYAPPAPFDRMFTGDYDGILAQMPRDPNASADPVDRYVAEQSRTGRLDDAEHEFVVGLYDGGVRYNDELVGRLLGVVDEIERRDDTLIMVTADHGEELGDQQGYYYHGNSMSVSALKIPLIVRWPGRVAAGETYDGLVQNTDVYPTLLRWLGVTPQSPVDGFSFAGKVGPGEQEQLRQHAFIEWQDLMVGVRDVDWAYTFNWQGIHPRKPPYFALEDHPGFVIRCEELYDRRGDPGEHSNLADRDSARAAAYRELADTHRSRPQFQRKWSVAEIDEAKLEELMSIGYVGAMPGRKDIFIGAENCDED